jgi:hypothetical protein
VWDLSDLARAVLAALLGAVVSGWFSSLTIGNRITKLEVVVSILAKRGGVDST